MPFQQLFTKRVNDNMQDAGPSNQENMTHSIDIEQHDSSMSKGKEAEAFYHSEDEEEVDMEKSEKGQPPRFSTLFTNPPPRQEPQYPVFISPPVQRKHRRGVFVPLPLIIFLMAILFLETAILFAYMLFRSFGSSGGMLGIGIDRQPAVNISPNFIVGGTGVVETRTVTTTVFRDINTSLPSDFLPGLSTTAASTSKTDSSSMSSSSIDPRTASQAAAAISGLLGIFAHTPSSSTVQPTSTVGVTVTPSAIIPTSVVLLTVDPQGNPITPQARSTVTSTYVPGLSSSSPDPAATSPGSSSAASAASSAPADGGNAGASSSAGGGASAAPAPPSSTASAPKSKNTWPACFGGAGAVQLNCV